MAYEMDLINYLTALHLAGVVSEEDFQSEVKALAARLPHTRENWREKYSHFLESMALHPDGQKKYHRRRWEDSDFDPWFDPEDQEMSYTSVINFLLLNHFHDGKFHKLIDDREREIRIIQRKHYELEQRFQKLLNSVSALVSAVNQSNLTRTAVEAAPRSSSNAKRIAQIRKEISSKISLLGGFAERGDLGKLEMYKADITLLESELRELGA